MYTCLFLKRRGAIFSFMFSVAYFPKCHQSYNPPFLSSSLRGISEHSLLYSMRKIGHISPITFNIRLRSRNTVVGDCCCYWAATQCSSAVVPLAQSLRRKIHSIYWPIIEDPRAVSNAKRRQDWGGRKPSLSFSPSP